MLSALLHFWARLLRCCNLGRPNYLLLEISPAGKRSFLFLLPLFAVRAAVEDACWLAGGLRYAPGLRKRLKVPPVAWEWWPAVTAAIPDLLRFRFPFTLLQLRDEDTRVEVSVL